MMVTASADVSASPQAVQQEAATTADSSDLKPAWCLLAAPVAIGVRASPAPSQWQFDADGPTATQTRRRAPRRHCGQQRASPWACDAARTGSARSRSRDAIAGGATCLAEALVASARFDDSSDDLAAIVTSARPRAAPGVRSARARRAFPMGDSTSRARQRTVVAGYVVGLAVGGALLSLDVDSITTWPIVALWVIAL
jgi:hypothetical protein